MTITLDFHFFFALAALVVSILSIYMTSQAERRIDKAIEVTHWLVTMERSRLGKCPPPPPMDIGL